MPSRYPDRLAVVAEGHVICEHARLIERSHHVPGRTIYDWRHYLAVIQRKPGALRNGAPFADFPDAFKQLRKHLLKQPGRGAKRCIERARPDHRARGFGTTVGAIVSRDVEGARVVCWQAGPRRPKT